MATALGKGAPSRQIGQLGHQAGDGRQAAAAGQAQAWARSEQSAGVGVGEAGEHVTGVARDLGLRPDHA